MKATYLTFSVLVFVCCGSRTFSQNGFTPSEFNMDGSTNIGITGEITGGVVGQPFGRRPDNSAFSMQNQNAGVLRAGSRFQRNARRGLQFVGSDTREQQSFVGAVQASTQAAGVSSVTGLVATSGPSAASTNRVRQPSPATAKYDPTLVVAFDLPTSSSAGDGQELTNRLSQLSDLQGCQVSVQVVGRTATIRGVVESPSQRRFVELYLQMEPGISSVDNQLQVIAEETLPSRATNAEPVPRAPRPLEPVPHPPCDE